MKMDQRRLGAFSILFVVALVGALLSASPVSAGGGTITVNTTEDELNEPDKTQDCSLREAIEAANTDVPVDGCASGDGSDQIFVPANTYPLDEGTPLQVTESVIFNVTGTGRAIVEGGARVNQPETQGTAEMDCFDVQTNRISEGTQSNGIFEVENATATFNDLVIRGGFIETDNARYSGAGLYVASTGSAFLNDSIVEHNFVAVESNSGPVNASGGGIQNSGELQLDNTEVRNNVVAAEGSADGGGIASDGTGEALVLQNDSSVGDNLACGLDFAEGGGISSIGVTEITESSVARNLAQALNTANGGGIANFSTKGGSTLNLTGSRVEGNVAQAYNANTGGGIYNAAGLDLLETTVSGNGTASGDGIASAGAGIMHDGVFLDIEKSTVDNNDANLVAPPLPAAIPNPAGGTGPVFSTGGGLYSNASSNILNSTFAENQADEGGGLYAEAFSGVVFLTQSTVAHNEAFEVGGGIFAGDQEGDTGVYLRHTLVGENESEDCFDVNDSIASQGYNLDTDGTCNLDEDSDLPDRDAMLLSLDQTEGPTRTISPEPESPAVDAIDPPQNTQTQGFVVGCPPPNQDQRGVQRPKNGDNQGPARCDMGAVEIRGGPVDKFCPGFQGDNRNQVIGTNASETLEGTKGPDVICGLNGNDTLRGFDGNDRILGGNGNDRIFGGDGTDNVFGGQDNDTISGGNQADTLHGKPGEDTISGDNGNDFIRGGNGVDTLSGGDDNDFLSGGHEGDTMRGNDGFDRMRGRKGDDFMFGGAKNDKLYGGFGFDALNGQDGDADFCVPSQEGGTTANCEQP